MQRCSPCPRGHSQGSSRPCDHVLAIGLGLGFQVHGLGLGFQILGLVIGRSVLGLGP